MAAAAPAAGAIYDLQLAHSHAALAALPEPKRVFKHLLMCLVRSDSAESKTIATLRGKLKADSAHLCLCCCLCSPLCCCFVRFPLTLRCVQETPRPSNEPGINHQLAITNKLLAFGAAHNLDAAVDPAGNVRLRKAASAGFEAATKIVVQSHMDVVCSKAQDKVHDFTKDPVTPIIEGNILRADRTTLGADDGIGVAAAMALLEETDPTFVHGPLEVVFTADEETTVSWRARLQARARAGRERRDDARCGRTRAGTETLVAALPVLALVSDSRVLCVCFSAVPACCDRCC